ncbi:MAG: Nuclease-related domain protein [Pedosphaera sp.]|nr:Nuclease-related domain protein [Pedosphaera sp.]
MAFLCLTPAVAALFIIFQKRRAWRAQRVVPFSELRRRPAGESLRLKLEKLDEEFNDSLLFFVGMPIAFTAASTVSHWSGFAYPVMIFLFSLIPTIWFGRKLYRVGYERANYQLGFDGERFVGEVLTQLVGKGYQIFHDLPFGNFNIDHVLVGPAGVFAVETKTHRKPVRESGGKDYRVEFDGSSLLWPWGTKSQEVNQAANGARKLGQWLSSVVGEKVGVDPILTLPGWMVNRKTQNATVEVLNPKEILNFCALKQKCLDANLIQRICYQLEEKCKLEMK